MQLPNAASTVYKQWWSTVSGWANLVNPDTGGRYQVTDVTAAAAEIARAEGSQFGRYGIPGISQLWSLALGIEKAADTLTAAPDEAALTSSMFAEAPWSRDQFVQDAAPMWKVQAEITYTDPQGNVLTGWTTGVFHTVLPTTVGALRDELQLQIQRMLTTPAPGTPRTGTLLDIGRTKLLQV